MKKNNQKKKTRGLKDLTLKGLLICVPLVWFLFVMEMTSLGQAGSPDKSASGHSNDVLKKVNDNRHTAAEHTDKRTETVLLDNLIRDQEETLKERQQAKELQYVNGDRVNPKLAWKETRNKIPAEENELGGIVELFQMQHRFDPPREGEYGVPVKIDKNRLSAEDRIKYEVGWNTHKFNEYVSTLISVQRNVPDYRDPKCQLNDYNGDLQPASIIMCFHNEAWSTLLRSVHSALDRSPAHLLKELILVDDFSDQPHLKDDLDKYMARFPKVKIVRMPERVGLVRARLRGVDQAQAPILVFLDSHVECADGWLEPLLYEVSRNSSIAVAPIIDIIDKDTLAVVAAVESMGVLELQGMTFTWSKLTPRVRKFRRSTAHPFVSPTMAGGLFAINKEFFYHLGTWDPGLVLWGGENLELSFKLWMCGGAILIHPCSRVSHVFRDASPYLQGDLDRVVSANAARVAEVWLDDYKQFYFGPQGSYDKELYGDVSDRKQLRHELACKDFQWYIDNVYPEMFIDGAGKFYGHITSISRMCLTLKTGSEHDLVIDDCSNAKIWQTSNAKEIRTDNNVCLTNYASRVKLLECDSQESAQAFIFTGHGDEEGGALKHIPSGRCLSSASLELKKCVHHDPIQIWYFKKNPFALL